MLEVSGISLINMTEPELSIALSSTPDSAHYRVYRPDTIRTFNPHKSESGVILSVTVEAKEDLLGFVLCNGYPCK